MFYDIKTSGSGRFEKIVVSNSRTGDEIVVYPKFGALLNNLRLSHGGRTFDVLEGYPDEAGLEGLSYSKGIKLSPFPNRIRDGRYDFNGHSYQLNINKANENNAIHGFLQRAAFTVEDMDSRYGFVHLVMAHTYDGSAPGYPFPYTLRLKYDFRPGEMTCTTEATNEGTGPMPFGDGWHPYFTLGEPADELLLELPAKDYLLTDERMIPTRQMKDIHAFHVLEPIAGHAFDTGFLLSPDESMATTRLHSRFNRVTLEMWQQTGPRKYNCLQVFVPPHRQSVALEPMTCAADAFNNGIELIILEPGERFSASYGVRLV